MTLGQGHESRGYRIIVPGHQTRQLVDITFAKTSCKFTRRPWYILHILVYTFAWIIGEANIIIRTNDLRLAA